MRSIKTSTGYIRTAWPVLLLLAAVLLPTACVLWLMNQAIGNQRLLVRQKLNDAYSSQLSLVRDRLDADWSAKAAALNVTPADATAFLRIVTARLADSAIILDSSGHPLYPAQLRVPSMDPTATDPAWIRARGLEETDPAAAPAAYSAIAEATADPATAARAWQAAARTLTQSGHGDAAAELVLQHFAGRASEQATDLQGRMIPADTLLMAIHFLKPGNPRLNPAARRLHDYCSTIRACPPPSAFSS
jgi:hypothetical protein